MVAFSLTYPPGCAAPILYSAIRGPRANCEAAARQMARIDLFGPMHKNRQRSTRKRKDRKRRSQ
jgi:hypothetical protein